MNGDSEWNRWRGEQTATLKLIKDELEDTKKALTELKKEFYIIKGKTILFGGLAGIASSGIMLIIQLYT